MLRSGKEFESSQPLEVSGKEVEVEKEPSKRALKPNSISFRDNAPLV